MIWVINPVSFICLFFCSPRRRRTSHTTPSAPNMAACTCRNRTSANCRRGRWRDWGRGKETSPRRLEGRHHPRNPKLRNKGVSMTIKDINFVCLFVFLNKSFWSVESKPTPHITSGAHMYDMLDTFCSDWWCLLGSSDPHLALRQQQLNHWV